MMPSKHSALKPSKKSSTEPVPPPNRSPNKNPNPRSSMNPDPSPPNLKSPKKKKPKSSSTSSMSKESELDSPSRKTQRKRKVREFPQEDGGAGAKNSAGLRLFVKDDTFNILNGMLEFRSKTGALPTYSTMKSFLDMIKDSLQGEISPDQVYNKIRHLRQKYNKTSARGPRPNTDDRMIYDISTKVWGSEGKNPSGVLDEKKSNGVFEENHNGGSGMEMDDGTENGDAGGGGGGDDDDKEEEEELEEEENEGLEGEDGAWSYMTMELMEYCKFNNWPAESWWRV